MHKVPQRRRIARNCRKDGRNAETLNHPQITHSVTRPMGVAKTGRMGEWIRKKKSATFNLIRNNQALNRLHNAWHETCRLHRSNSKWRERSKWHRSGVCLYRLSGRKNNEGCIDGTGEQRMDHVIALKQTRSGQVARKMAVVTRIPDSSTINNSPKQEASVFSISNSNSLLTLCTARSYTHVTY